ncbi:hypothetical protein BJ741DRAFT_582298 [Chytriomyces cf. hyalinus JEL632]|nr:hypothetical protein BJ741DRAFT_582298 [Chytriomyces cf. hyalinus JEL632]
MQASVASRAAYSQEDALDRGSLALPAPRAQRPQPVLTPATAVTTPQTPSLTDEPYKTILKVSVKQRNGSLATITTTPAKVTRGFMSPSSWPNQQNQQLGRAVPVARSVGMGISYPPGNGVGGDGFMPSDYQNTSPSAAGMSYNRTSSRTSVNSMLDATVAAGLGVQGSGESSYGSLMHSQRIYSNASSASATSLQTFFGAGEGQLLKEKLMREQEARELYHQQLIQLQQQQQQQQQQQRSESVSGRRQKRVDSKHTADLSSEMRSKASFAIGVDEDEDEDDIDSDVSSVANGSTTLKLVEAHRRAASSGKSLSPSHMLTPDSLDGSCSKHVKPSTSPILPRRTFPSAPYLPLYNKPSTGSLKSPIQASTKLIMNPNPNSSSAADIPMLNTTHAEKQPNDTQTDADLMHALSVKSNGSSTGGGAPKPIPFSKTGSGNGTQIPSNVDCETRLKHLPPEHQAPLHQTPPTGTVSTDADIAAAAAAARARGTNVPRSVSEFHRRLSDLRNHHVQQLNALALQIDLLKRGVASGNSAQTCEYYEREIVKVAEGARREEGWLLEYGRRAMGIDVNTLKRMLASLNSFDMHRFLAGVHGSSDPAIRKTKSTTHIPGQQQYDQQVPSIQQLQQQQLQQQHIQQQRLQQLQHHQQALSEQLIRSDATIPQRTRSHARVMDLLAIRELDSGQVVSVIENTAAANTDAASTEFVQMQYDAQVVHLKSVEKRASETRRPESVHNAAFEVSERSGGGSVAVYSSVRGNSCGMLDKPIVFEDESGSFDAGGVEDIDSCGTVHGDCEEDRIVDGMDRGLESSGELRFEEKKESKNTVSVFWWLKTFTARMRQLPPEVVQDVFAWLEPTTVLQLRRIDTRTNGILSNPNFARLCLARHRPQVFDTEELCELSDAGNESGEEEEAEEEEEEEEESLSADAQATQALQPTTLPTYQASRMATSNMLHALFSPRISVASLTDWDRAWFHWPRSFALEFGATKQGCTEICWDRKNLNGRFPLHLCTSLPALVNLSFAGNYTSGFLPDSLGHLTSLTKLNLSRNEFSGNIPESIGLLANLQLLDLSHNILTGAIPESLGQCLQLCGLLLNHNRISGRIPESLYSLTNLVFLGLDHNNLSGALSPSIGMLTALLFVNLGSNQLTGEIPASIGNLSQLCRLYLQNNQFSGTIPDSLGDLALLENMSLMGNRLHGPGLPAALCRLTLLESLEVHENPFLSGNIPAKIRGMQGLRYLNVSGTCMRGRVPEDVALLPKFAELQTTEPRIAPKLVNMLQQTLPMETVQAIFKWLSPTSVLKYKRLSRWIDTCLSDSHFARENLSCFNVPVRTVTDESETDSVRELEDDEVELDGSEGDEGLDSEAILPPKSHLQLNTQLWSLLGPESESSNILSLREWDLAWFHWPAPHQTAYALLELSTKHNLVWRSMLLKGAVIPRSIGVLKNLCHLSLADSGLTGPLPFELGNLANLQTLNLSGNQIYGSIPDSLTRLRGLKWLNLSGNLLTGSLPADIGALQSLQVLMLHKNQLSDELPASLWTCRALLLLKLDNNKFTGTLACTNSEPGLDQLSQLECLDLSQNQFSGALPAQLGSLTRLCKLYLGGNAFSGELPDAWGCLKRLQECSVRGNKLNGFVPWDAVLLLRDLQTLDLSGNTVAVVKVSGCVGNKR